MLISWNDDEHSLGFEVIDAGHRLVVDCINRLNACDHRAASRETATVLRQLTAQLARQFHHEEAVMMLSRSPHLAEQRTAHHRMMATLAHLADRHRSGESVRALLLLNLVAFLGSHLRGADVEEFATPTRRVA